MTVTIRPVTADNADALLLPNQPFARFGHFHVTRDERGWQHSETLDAQPTTQTFPEEGYKLADIDAAGFALAAYDGTTCVGLATFEWEYNRFVYLADLKVNSDYRRAGIGSQLLDAAKPVAREHGCQGMSTIAQGSNLAANRFYLKYGFQIGGLETFRYEFTSAKGESDIHYWLAL